MHYFLDLQTLYVIAIALPGVRWAIIEQVVAVISNDGLGLTKYVLRFIANIIFESVRAKLSPA